jgi:hypothetical protein
VIELYTGHRTRNAAGMLLTVAGALDPRRHPRTIDGKPGTVP